MKKTFKLKTLKHLITPLLLSIILFVAGWLNLDKYHITWDEALGEFFFGQRFASFVLTLDDKYLDFMHNPYSKDTVPDLSESILRTKPNEHYAIGNTLGALCCKLFYEKLHLLQPFEAFHLANLFLCILLINILFLFLTKEVNFFLALSSLLFLFSSPRIFAHIMANIKDIPMLVLFTCTIISYYKSFKQPSLKKFICSGILLGIAIAAKTNSIFIPLIVYLSYFISNIIYKRPLFHLQKNILFVVSILIALTSMVIFWPTLWENPIQIFLQHLKFIGLRNNSVRSISYASPLINLFGTLPLLFITFFIIGLGTSWKEIKKGKEIYLWCIVWVIVVLSRYILPQGVNYDGIRHFIEVLPAMAIIASFGILWFLNLFKIKINILKTSLILIIIAPGYISIINSHPFQLTYWNDLVGGYKGAREKKLSQASDYWGTSYALGLKWLNQHAKKNAILAVPIMEHAVQLSSKIYLRPDILCARISNAFTPHLPEDRLMLLQQASQTIPVYVMFVPRKDWENQLTKDCQKRLKPVKVWKYQSQPVLYIYRYKTDMNQKK